MSNFGSKVHIPTADGLACGSRSAGAAVNTNERLCDRCLRSLAAKLRRAVRDAMVDGASPARVADAVVASVLGVSASVRD